jgi:heme A synthase
MPPADAAGVHVAHRALGIVVAILTLIVANGLRRIDPRAACLLFACAIAAPLLGVAAILALPSLPLAVLHNAAAALTIAALAAAAARR